MSQIKNIEKLNIVPAQIDTNIEEVSKSLDLVLEKYKGLVFTEENVTECKATIAQLNKGKKNIDDFRKKVEKELTKNVTKFKGEVKELLKKIDDVIDPIKKQYDKFEEDRQNEKRERVQIFINEIIREFDLDEKFAKELSLDDSYLNKTANDKKIKEDLENRANTLLISQQKYYSDIETIKTKVELANAKNNTRLVPDPYISLLNYEDIKSISEKIFIDAEKTTVKEELPKKIEKYEKTNDEKFIEKYEVTGSEKQLDDLEEYMSSRGFTWKII